MSFEFAILKNAIFSGAILPNSQFNQADLEGVRLDGAYLREARILASRMGRADLRWAMLFEAVLHADLSGVRFEGANLRGTDLSKSSNLTQAQIDLTCMDERTKLPDGLIARRNPGMLDELHRPARRAELSGRLWVAAVRARDCAVAPKADSLLHFI